ncbi:thymidine phosphorylase [Ostreiculturibacter nitratireducens]|uniref:thymidine phosphorylase n=1 Tax=Ostreiculturibacter nitratireducens TaxID=3075226 RepID=UPI0031B640CE
MDARSIIAAVRDRKGLRPEAAKWFADGLASGDVTDAQAGAFAMAVLLNGLGAEGRVALTEAMRDSGQVLTWDLPGPVVDKHSTGGIGDCISLLLAPALAACGAYVPMISGRGLGHTGGTLDKLEAIPGYRTDVSVEDLHRIVADTGCAIVGASANIAPADRRLYGIRDISGTVESIDLITASILSKKLAAGLEALVLDVKCGSGAFMKTKEDAKALAISLVDTANGAGCRTAALITDMDEPLATEAGNALEVIAALETLTCDEVNPALWDLTVDLGGEALALAGLAKDAEEGANRVSEAMESGRAAEIFGKMVAALGGPKDFIEHYRDRLPAAPVLREVFADEAGHVAKIDAEALGHAVVHLGGGRLKGGEKINPSVGLSALAKVGDTIDEGEPIALVHAATEAEAQKAIAEVRRAYRLSESPVEPWPLVLEKVG